MMYQFGDFSSNFESTSEAIPVEWSTYCDISAYRIYLVILLLVMAFAATGIMVFATSKAGLYPADNLSNLRQASPY